MTDGVQSYQWDAAGRLVQVSGPGGLEVVYSYDGANDRVAMVVNGVTTTYVVDPFGLVDSVSQVLLEETAGAATRYLYGLDLFAQQGGATTYLAYDALSVRLHTDEDGAVARAYRYGPFGEEEGERPAGYGYSGERWDGAAGLLYLRARYYRPAVGRFFTRDALQGSYDSPQSLNRFVYAVNGPANQADPSGLAADAGCGGACYADYRNLTDWLYREMVNNANSPEVRSIRGKLELIDNLMMPGPCYWSNLGVVDRYGVHVRGGADSAQIATGIWTSALLDFKRLVQNGAKWDFKDEIGIRLGPGITLCDAGRCYDDIEYSVPGNIFYGYIGTAAGLGGTTIQIGATVAERIDPAHNKNSKEYVAPYQGVVRIDPRAPAYTWNFGDDPQDHEAVTLGIMLWMDYGAGMTRGQFQGEVGGYISRLARHLPRRRPVDPRDAAAYPYSVGYFNNRGQPYIIGEETP